MTDMTKTDLKETLAKTLYEYRREPSEKERRVAPGKANRDGVDVHNVLHVLCEELERTKAYVQELQQEVQTLDKDCRKKWFFK